MDIPQHVRALIDHELAVLDADPTATVLPVTRLALYDAFGPTAASSSLSDRIDRIRSGRLALTSADRVRARLALLTAHHVLPLWLDSLDTAGLLVPEQIADDIRSIVSEFIHQHVASEGQAALLAVTRQHPLDYHRMHHAIMLVDAAHIDAIQRSLLAESVAVASIVSTQGPAAEMPITLNPQLAAHRSIFFVPLITVPTHILQLAQGVLQGTIDPRIALDQSADIQQSLGNMIEYAEEDFPAQAYDVCLATSEALNQALGLGSFDGREITSMTTDEVLLGKGAAAAAAVKAVSGMFEDRLSTREYDTQRRRSFWIWWLNEAIPEAWRTEPDGGDPALSSTPFRATVQVTTYDTGLRFRL